MLTGQLDSPSARRVAGALRLYGGSPIADRRFWPGGGKLLHVYV